LWRYACKLPARGDIGIFNRSHYEEVLVVRVHPELLERQRLPKESKGHDVWKRRYREINDWERYLTDNGIKVVKLFLNLSKEEQRRRFLARIDVPDKNWKFSANDARERRYWDDYQKAFSQMLSATSTTWAPWYVVPADRKWFARICVSAILAHTLFEIDPRYPTVDDAARNQLLEAKRALEAEAPKGVAPDPITAALGNGPAGHNSRKSTNGSGEPALGGEGGQRRAASHAAGATAPSPPLRRGLPQGEAGRAENIRTLDADEPRT
jgi:hypothetical protein